MTTRKLAPVIVAASTAIALAGPAAAQNRVIAAYGSESNFDVFNDDPSGREAEGFDIEIEGATSADILGEYTYNGYGGVKLLPYDNVVPDPAFTATDAYGNSILDTCSVTTDGQPACVARAYIYYVPPTMTPLSETVPVNQNVPVRPVVRDR